jgi:hypothetical protein
VRHLESGDTSCAQLQVENLKYLIQQVPDGIHGGTRLSPTKKVFGGCIDPNCLHHDACVSPTRHASTGKQLQGFAAADGGGIKPVLNIEARWHGEGYFDQTEESSKFRQVCRCH